MSIRSTKSKALVAKQGGITQKVMRQKGGGSDPTQSDGNDLKVYNLEKDGTELVVLNAPHRGETVTLKLDLDSAFELGMLLIRRSRG